MCAQRPFFLHVNHPFPHLIAICAPIQWNSLSKCGALSKTAPWIAPSISGDVQGPAAKAKTEGKLSHDACTTSQILPPISTSIRAWRGLRFNAKYAAKLEQKLARKREREKAKADALAAEAAQKQAAVKSNPFSVRERPNNI